MSQCAWSYRKLLLLASLGAIFATVLIAGLWAPHPVAADPALSVRFFVDADLADGLVAYFKFDEGNGSLARSFPNTTLTGTLGGNAAYAAATSGAITRFDPHSLALDGNGDDVTISATAGLNSLTQSFTVAAWVRRTSTGTYDSVYDSGDNANRWWLFIADAAKGNRPGFGMRGITETYAAVAITDTAWHHLAVAKSNNAGSNLTLYVDGVAQGAAAIGNVQLPTGAKRIGSLLEGSKLAFFGGNLDELRVYDHDLSPQQIAALAAGRGCATDGLSWAGAFTDLQCALDIATPGREIWMTTSFRPYLPGVVPTATFILSRGVSLYGGFFGGETALDQRPQIDFMVPYDGLVSTNLSGQLYPGGNAHSVVRVVGPGARVDDVAVSDGNSPGNGGGILVDFTGSLTLTMSEVSNNHARFGGGLYACCGAVVRIENVLFGGNTALSGGGVGICCSTAPHVISHTWFAFNTARDMGGGLDVNAVSGGPLLLHDVAFDHNQAGKGGGLSFAGGADLRLNRATLSHNIAMTQGGAIALQSASGLTLTNMVAAANSSAGSGGALQLAFGSALVINSDLVSNTAATGGALSVTLGTLGIANSILWLNAPDQIALKGTTAVTVTNGIVAGGWPTGTHILTGDPRFAGLPGALDAGDLHLRLDSPAIDAGTNTAVLPDMLSDLAGRPRRADVPAVADTGVGSAPVVDIGAYEAPGGIYLPLIRR